MSEPVKISAKEYTMGDVLRSDDEGFDYQYTQPQAKRMHDLLSTMTTLTKLKYGNSDEGVYSEIEKAEKLLNELKEIDDDS